ncbi:S-layer homology domain-containing protein [Paenibacillus sp. OVF10]|nr:S-layer homology domain-containing protein [Paenibacillus sp. OVF10]
MNNRLKDITNQRIWKMALCGLLTLGSVAGYGSTVQAATVQQQFQDTRTSYAKDAITHLVAKGIAAGTSKTTFEPKKAVTRAEFATFAVRLLGLKPVKNNINPYQDISMNAWYYGNVAAMTNLLFWRVRVRERSSLMLPLRAKKRLPFLCEC